MCQIDEKYIKIMYSSNSFLLKHTSGIQKFEKVDIKEEEFIQIVTKK